jgi:hypothetical protein
MEISFAKVLRLEWEEEGEVTGELRGTVEKKVRVEKG